MSRRGCEHHSRDALPFLNWAGSKRHVAKYLVKRNIPPFRRYFEPFLGSGAFYLSLASSFNIEAARLSDKNHHLIAAFEGVKTDPEAVARSLRMHQLLDSEVHFSGNLHRLNACRTVINDTADHAAAVIYALTQSFHSAWYETLDGRISLSRRAASKPFRPKFQRIFGASSLLSRADLHCEDFRNSMIEVSADDLVFIDPPYIKLNQVSDRRAYTVDRFNRADFSNLLSMIERCSSIGAHTIFCWGEQLDSEIFAGGRWIELGNDHVWVSYLGKTES